MTSCRCTLDRCDLCRPPCRYRVPVGEVIVECGDRAVVGLAPGQVPKCFMHMEAAAEIVGSEVV